VTLRGGSLKCIADHAKHAAAGLQGTTVAVRLFSVTFPVVHGHVYVLLLGKVGILNL
jgi:hypothetical protein